MMPTRSDPGRAAPLDDRVRWDTYGRGGLPAVFSHANGFPSRAYAPFLGRLTGLQIHAVHMRPTWPGIGAPPRRRDWNLHADDLIAFIEHAFDEPVLAIGHSMGATCTALAAARRPDLFHGLVMIEPASVGAGLALACRLLPKALMARMQPAKGTLRKADTWPSREAFLSYCRRFKGYGQFDEEAFAALAAHGVEDLPDGRVALVFPKDWEAHNYTQPPSASAVLRAFEMPCVAIRGRPSLFLGDSLWHDWKARAPATCFLEDTRFGHLLPLEAPRACADLVRRGLAEASSSRAR